MVQSWHRRSRRRGRATTAAMLGVRDDAYRVHEALDVLRDAVHEAAPGLTRLACTMRGVRASLDGTGRDLPRVARCLADDARRLVRS